MNIVRNVGYALGAFLIVVGLVLLFVESGLAAWVPLGVALAGLLIVLGFVVLGLAETPPEPRARTEVVDHVHDPPRREVVEHREAPRRREYHYYRRRN